MNAVVEALAAKLFEELRDGDVAGVGRDPRADELLKELLTHKSELPAPAGEGEIDIPVTAGGRIVLVPYDGGYLASAGLESGEQKSAMHAQEDVAYEGEDPLQQAEEGIRQIESIDFRTS
jgi:hypothetical protein